MENFGDQLKHISLRRFTGDFRKTHKILRDMVDEMQGWLRKETKQETLRLQLQPGVLVNLGQQLNVRLFVEQPSPYEETLFRIYVPPSGLPVTLDFYGEEPKTCRTVGAVQKAVIGFLNEPEIQVKLRVLSDES